MLRDEAVLYSDGGGKRKTALRPIQGADAISRMLGGLAAKGRAAGNAAYRVARVNGLPGVLLKLADGGHCCMALEISGGRVDGVYMIYNPDKLAAVDLEHVDWIIAG